MKIHRIVIIGLLWVSVVFLSESLGAEEIPSPVIKKQKPVSDVIVRKNSVSVKAIQKKIKGQQKPVAVKQEKGANENDLAKPSEPQKPLDLSIPFTNSDKSDRLTDLNTEGSIQKANIFAGENRKKTQPVQIDGKLLMSPEPEIEKLKSADGAGIVINLKP
jgi:hypothetical protein